MMKLFNAIAVLSLLASSAASRSMSGEKTKKNFIKRRTKTFKLKITNLTFQQPFGGFFVMTHNSNADPLFTLGDMSTPELGDLAENGSPAMLVALYDGAKGVGSVQGFGEGAPYFGGDSLEIEIPYDERYPYVTVASMAINTNDCFVALNGVKISPGVINGVGYDSGTEINNELCSSIPGPACAMIDTANTADGMGEGFVHVHRGFFGIGGELSASGYDWRNPMARFEIMM
eukprot:scaffold1453_cov195-Amphora_coffeaeformis.AAC.9